VRSFSLRLMYDTTTDCSYFESSGGIPSFPNSSIDWTKSTNISQSSAFLQSRKATQLLETKDSRDELSKVRARWREVRRTRFAGLCFCSFFVVILGASLFIPVCKKSVSSSIALFCVRGRARFGRIEVLESFAREVRKGSVFNSKALDTMVFTTRNRRNRQMIRKRLSCEIEEVIRKRV